MKKWQKQSMSNFVVSLVCKTDPKNIGHVTSPKLTTISELCLPQTPAGSTKVSHKILDKKLQTDEILKQKNGTLVGFGKDHSTCIFFFLILNLQFLRQDKGDILHSQKARNLACFKYVVYSLKST